MPLGKIPTLPNYFIFLKTRIKDYFNFKPTLEMTYTFTKPD